MFFETKFKLVPNPTVLYSSNLMSVNEGQYYFKVVEDGYEFFAKRQLVTLFSAPNYCGEFDNAGAMMSVDETLMCSFQILKVSRVRREEGGRRHAKK